jgi:transposase
MIYQYFLGIDTSKGTVDYCLYQKGKKLLSRQVSNDKAGLQALEKHLKSLGITKDHLLVCVEHTGIYNSHLLTWAMEAGYALWLENPTAIKRSLGIQRGKNDQVDAQRIAQYAARFSDKARLWEPPREVIEELKALMKMRERLLNTKMRLETPLQESGLFLAANKQKGISSLCKGTIGALKKDIAQLEKQIQALIDSDQQLKESYVQVSSVVGVGKVTALELIVVSNEFNSIKTAKSCACYCGVAPFEHRSGSSIRGRTRLSPLANKRLKKLLHMGAMAAIRARGEFRDYYQRKVEEGKNKMSVLNTIRNKLLERVYACVRDKRSYSLTYQGGTGLAA